jgi:NAD(P)H-dependent flavin oxidoreductase YrpB (nitropropane dioxygenase family)
MLGTRFTALVGCRFPLQQAGMGGVATPALAAAVSEAGGLGMLGGAGIPPELLSSMLDETARLTRAPFGINFLMPFLERECVAIAAAKAKVVEFFYGAPDASLIDIVHRGGALATWQVGSAKEAVEAAEAGCDFLIAQGTEGGGHIRGTLGLLPVLAEVLEKVRIPVLAAGGIGTGRAIAGALAAGADGVRVGTRFLAAVEADVHPAYLERLIAAQAEDAILTLAFWVGWPGAPHRVLRSAVDAAATAKGEIVAQLALGGVTRPIPRFSVEPPTRGATGQVEAMALYAGQSVGSVRRQQPAAEIVRELMEDAERPADAFSRSA